MHADAFSSRRARKSAPARQHCNVTICANSMWASSTRAEPGSRSRLWFLTTTPEVLHDATNGPVAHTYSSMHTQTSNKSLLCLCVRSIQALTTRQHCNVATHTHLACKFGPSSPTLRAADPPPPPLLGPPAPRPCVGKKTGLRLYGSGRVKEEKKPELGS